MSTNATLQPTALERLVIESEIRRLLATYVHNLDFGKIDANADLLAHAKLKVIDTFVSGRDDVAHFLKTNLQYHDDDTPRTWHSVSNVLIEIDTVTTARSVSYFTVHQELSGLPLQPIVTGRYLDTFELHEGAWRFASREVDPRLFGDISRHVATTAENITS
ncbi:nuclear transport factor 2 family protein [Kaistia terrae]|uniref:Nuclear transport factor 2 family protein n=1 Tax=Kaistia terrae TaxID=537017 RepID=A0ABW0PYI6_9HYPH|nr:nuclear transport factor 2 family protein [Kaistia terrae]MCX5580276.1 nuclear transport factor 2 family protein [Kaistia terrae]